MINYLAEKFAFVKIELVGLLQLPFAIFLPRNPHKIIFGAWGGRQFSCNPKYLMEYILSRGGYECVWIGEKRLEPKVLALPGAKFATRYSLASYWHMFTASFYAYNINWRSDLMRVPRCHRTVLLYLTHGSPDKKTGDLQLTGNGEIQASKKHHVRELFRKMFEKIDAYLFGQESWCSATSPQGEEIRLSNMGFRLAKERMIHCGTPRFDFMMNNANNMELRQKFRAHYAKLLGIDPSKKWYVFVPTWRHDVKDTFSFSTSPRIKDYAKLLEDQNAIIIEKQHPKIFEMTTIKGGYADNVCVVDRDQSKDIDLQELMLACDRLITDYSSVYYDFYLINRPVIHFTYDFDHFMNTDIGFNFDIREYGGGPFAYTEDELLKYMAMDDAQLLSLRNEKTKEQLSYETGHACEGYYNLIERLSKK